MNNNKFRMCPNGISSDCKKLKVVKRKIVHENNISFIRYSILIILNNIYLLFVLITSKLKFQFAIYSQTLRFSSRIYVTTQYHGALGSLISLIDKNYLWIWEI